MYLGQNIKMIRKRWRLQQEPFAELLNSNRGRVSNYEGNHNEPKLEFMVQLENLSGIPIKEIYTRFLTNEEIPIAPIPKSKWTTQNPPLALSELKQELAMLKSLVMEFEIKMKRLEG